MPAFHWGFRWGCGSVVGCYSSTYDEWRGRISMRSNAGFCTTAMTHTLKFIYWTFGTASSFRAACNMEDVASARQSSNATTGAYSCWSSDWMTRRRRTRQQMFKEAVQHLISLPFHRDMESFAKRNLGRRQTGFALGYFLLESYDSTATHGKEFQNADKYNLCLRRQQKPIQPAQGSGENRSCCSEILLVSALSPSHGDR